jgi:hypothetical protein
MIPSIVKWSNENQGILTIIIFMVTIGLGWASGIFRTLRQRPKLKLNLLPGPTFCCTYLIGEKHGEYEVHRIGFALYLHVANIGSAPSSIEQISIGYHWNIIPFSLLWLKYRIGWFWLHNQTAALMDFQANIGENLKIYPFLTQRSMLSGESSETFLEIGRSTNGVVYFEQPDSWGACSPIVRDGKVKLRVRITDVFGKIHQSKFDIPSVPFEEARKYNPAFGKTYADLRGKPLPVDILPSQATE